MDKKIISRYEDIKLIDFDIQVSAKIDTGADTSSLHCTNIKLKNKVLTFNILDENHENYHDKVFSAKLEKIKKVKSSNGIMQKRYFIKTKALILGEVYDMLISLSDRSSMNYPMLLGCEFLSHKFLVDVSKGEEK